ncbi:MAG TPA: hypothetical protein VE011_05210 [Candidatus Dormibacteraeota bacterium]|nr:hypothetical protein [Candidatus Dormibacteraeota bacterium]
MSKVTIERVRNGYIIRDEAEFETSVVAEDNEVTAAWLMLSEINGLIGHPGSRHDGERVRVIVLPGDKWLPAKPGGCPHNWAERHQWGENAPEWWCPCGAEFSLTKPGGSWAEELEPGTPRDDPAC